MIIVKPPKTTILARFLRFFDRHMVEPSPIENVSDLVLPEDREDIKPSAPNDVLLWACSNQRLA